MTTNIKDMVSEGKKVRFLRYKLGELWYVTETGFEFPVPVEDCGDGTFLHEDKAILFMRYIRKHIKFLKDAEEEQRLRAAETPLPTEAELLAAEQVTWEGRRLGSIIHLPDGSTFRCECGCNVFTKDDPTHFTCNGCQAKYTGERND